MKRRDFLRVLGVLSGSTLMSSCGSRTSKRFVFPILSPEEGRNPPAAKRRGEVPGDFLGEGLLPGFGIPRRFPQRRAEEPLPVRKDHRLPLHADRQDLQNLRGGGASRV